MANWASIERLGNPADPEWQKKNLAWVEPVPGQRWQVYAPAAKAFEGLLGELAAQGYPLKSSGGFNYRNMRGSNKLSQHAFGTAIDVNAATNPMLSRGAQVVTDLPANTAELAKKYGLEWGGNWKRPDAMHFEWVGDPSLGTMIASQEASPPQASGTPAPALPDPINVSRPSATPMKSETPPPAGLFAAMSQGAAPAADKMSGLLEMLGQLDQPQQQPMQLQPMQRQANVPSLTDYISQFISGRMA